MAKKYLLKGGRYIDPSTTSDAVIDILIVDGIIDSMKPSIAPPLDCEVIDLRGKIVAPGFC